jgi:signal peptidase I
VATLRNLWAGAWDRIRGKKKPPEKKKSAMREWGEMVLTLAVFAVFVRMFMFQIPSGSMEDTLLVGDYIFVNRFLYGLQIPFSDTRLPEFRDPEPGDVIVFKFPPDPSKNYIKRVVGAPGDTIEVRDRVVFRNGERQEESFTKHIAAATIPERFEDRNVYPPGSGNLHWYGPIVVPEDAYFVMGDNRDNSEDSRIWGFVPHDYVKGRAIFIYWSWNKEKWLPRITRLGRIVH